MIQNDIGNEHAATTIVASITTAPKKSYPMIVRLAPRDSGLEYESAVDLGSIVTILKSQLEYRCGRLSGPKVHEVDRAICISLGIKIE